MSSATIAPTERFIYRHSILFCILPSDLGRHVAELKAYYEDVEDVEIVAERRASGDRRLGNASAPEGIDRRLGQRRESARTGTAAAVGFELPRGLRRHADRIVCTWRELPVHLRDAVQEADRLFATAGVDELARDELRLRYHPRVYGTVSHVVSRRRAPEVTDLVFDELFAHHASGDFSREVTSATRRVLSQL